MVEFNISENISIREIENSQSLSANKKLNQKPNAYYLKNSQYLKKEERDPLLVRSCKRDGYLVPITRLDILEKYKDRFQFELVYDPIIDEPLRIQKLISLKIWKKEEQKNKFLEISKRSLQLGIKLKECKTHFDPALTALYKEYADLQEQLYYLDREINYQRQISKDESWDEPVPLPVGLPAVEPFIPDMLPDALQAWIIDIADRMQIPPDFSAVSCIVVLASLIGRKVGIYPKRQDDWFVVPNLWGAIVGRPSLLKSPAIAEVIKPLDILIKNSLIQYEEKMSSYKQKLMLLEAQKSSFKDILKQSAKRAAKQGSSIKIEDFIENKNVFLEPEKPILKRYKTEDSTIEKIGEILKDNPQGILMHRDELSGWLKSLDKYGREGDRSFYLEAWNGSGSFTVDRIGRGTLHIPALCISILGGIQPGPLASYIYQASKGGIGDDGLLQRFQLLVWPDAPKKWKNVDRLPNNNAKQRAYNIYKGLDLLELKYSELFGLRFADNAQNQFDLWRTELEEKIRNGQLPSALESHLAKYRSLMPSLALIFHLIEMIDLQREFSPVSLKATELAIKWCKYLESHAFRLYSSEINCALESAKALMNKIKKGEIQDGCSLRDIYYGKHWSYLSHSKEVENAVRILEDLGWIRLKKVIGNGRPKTVIQFHPLLKKQISKVLS